MPGVVWHEYHCEKRGRARGYCFASTHRRLPSRLFNISPFSTSSNLNNPRNTLQSRIHMTSHFPESASLPLAIQASSTQTSLDADRGSHDVSSAPRPTREATPRQLLGAKDVGAHEPDHAVHEPPRSYEGHSAADEETSLSSHPSDAPAEAPVPVSAANPHPNPPGHSVFGLKTKHSHARPQDSSQRELPCLCIESTRI